MSQASRARPRRLRLGMLYTGGERHPLQDALAIFTLLAGILAFITGFMTSLHAIASCAGLAALCVGLYAQMISATRPERMIIVTGLVGAFVGFALGLAHGGFIP